MSSSSRLTDHSFFSEGWLKIFENLSPADKAQILEQHAQSLRGGIDLYRGREESQKFHRVLLDAVDGLYKSQNELFEEDGLVGILGIQGSSTSGVDNKRSSLAGIAPYGSHISPDEPEMNSRDFILRTLFTLGSAVARCLPQDGYYCTSLLPSSFYEKMMASTPMIATGSVSPTATRGRKGSPHYEGFGSSSSSLSSSALGGTHPIRITHSRTSSVTISKPQPGTQFSYIHHPSTKAKTPTVSSPVAQSATHPPLNVDGFHVSSDCVHVYMVEHDRCYREGEHTRAFRGGHPLECDKSYSCFRCNAHPREYNEPSYIHQLSNGKSSSSYDHKDGNSSFLDHDAHTRIGFINPRQITDEQGIVGYAITHRESVYTILTQEDMKTLYGVYREGWYLCMVNLVMHEDRVLCATEVILHYSTNVQPPLEHAQVAANIILYIHQQLRKAMLSYLNLTIRYASTLHFNEQNTLLRSAVDLILRYRDPFSSYHDQSDHQPSSVTKLIPRIMKAVYTLVPSERIALYMGEDAGVVNMMQQYRYNEDGMISEIDDSSNSGTIKSGSSDNGLRSTSSTTASTSSTSVAVPLRLSPTVGMTSTTHPNDNTHVDFTTPTSSLTQHQPAKPIPIPRAGLHTYGSGGERLSGKSAVESAPRTPSITRNQFSNHHPTSTNRHDAVINDLNYDRPSTPSRLPSSSPSQRRMSLYRNSISTPTTSTSSLDEMVDYKLDSSVIIPSTTLLNSIIDLHNNNASSSSTTSSGSSSPHLLLQPSTSHLSSHLLKSSNHPNDPEPSIGDSGKLLMDVPRPSLFDNDDNNDDDTNDKQLVCIVGADNSMLLRRVPWGHGVSGYVAATQCPRIDSIDEPRLTVDLGRTPSEWANNNQTTQYYSSTLRRMQTRPPFRPQHVLTVPILDSDANTVAVLQFFNKLPAPNTTRCRTHSHTEFSDKDQDLILAISPTIATALAVSRLKQQAVQNDRKTRTLLGLLRLPSVSNDNWAQLFSHMAEITREALSAEMVAIYLVEKGTPIKIARRYASRNVGARVDEDMILYCATHGIGINMRDAQTQWRYRETTRNNRSVLCIPVHVQSKTKTFKDSVGIIQVINKRRKRDVLIRSMANPSTLPPSTSANGGGGMNGQPSSHPVANLDDHSFASSQHQPPVTIQSQLISPLPYNTNNYMSAYYNNVNNNTSHNPHSSNNSNPTIMSTIRPHSYYDDMRESINSSIGAFAHYHAPQPSSSSGTSTASVISGGNTGPNAVGNNGVGANTQINLNHPPDFHDFGSQTMRSSMSFHYDTTQFPMTDDPFLDGRKKQCTACGAIPPQLCQCNIYDDGADSIQLFDQSDVEILIAISVHLSSTFRRSIFEVLFDSMTRQHAARYFNGDIESENETEVPVTYEDATVYSLLSFYSKDHQLNSAPSINTSNAPPSALSSCHRSRRMSLPNHSLATFNSAMQSVPSGNNLSSSGHHVLPLSSTMNAQSSSTSNSQGVGSTTVSVGPSSLTRRGSIIVPLSLGAPYQAQPQHHQTNSTAAVIATGGGGISTGNSSHMDPSSSNEHSHKNSHRSSKGQIRPKKTTSMGVLDDSQRSRSLLSGQPGNHSTIATDLVPPGTPRNVSNLDILPTDTRNRSHAELFTSSPLIQVKSMPPASTINTPSSQSSSFQPQHCSSIFPSTTIDGSSLTSSDTTEKMTRSPHSTQLSTTNGSGSPPHSAFIPCLGSSLGLPIEADTTPPQSTVSSYTSTSSSRTQHYPMLSQQDPQLSISNSSTAITSTPSTSSSPYILQYVNSSGTQPTLRPSLPQTAYPSAFFGGNPKLNVEYREFNPFSLPLPIDFNMGWPLPMFTQDVDENDPEFSTLVEMNLGESTNVQTSAIISPAGQSPLTTPGSNDNNIPSLTSSSSTHQIHIRTPISSPTIQSKIPPPTSTSTLSSASSNPTNISVLTSTGGVHTNDNNNAPSNNDRSISSLATLPIPANITSGGSVTTTIPSNPTDIRSSTSVVVAGHFNPLEKHLVHQQAAQHNNQHRIDMDHLDGTSTSTPCDKPPLSISSSSHSRSSRDTRGDNDSYEYIRMSNSNIPHTRNNSSLPSTSHRLSDSCHLKPDNFNPGDKQSASSSSSSLIKSRHTRTFSSQLPSITLTEDNNLEDNDHHSPLISSNNTTPRSLNEMKTSLGYHTTKSGKPMRYRILTSLFSPFSSPTVQISLVPIRIASPSLNHFNYNEIDMCVAIYNTLVFIGTVSHFQCHYTTLQSFIISTAALYRDNPFHNFIHGFNVFQFAYRMLVMTADSVYSLDDRLRGEGWIIPAFEASCLLIGALCHDLDHPGNTNAFEVHTQSPLAYLHNGTSVLEHHHVNILTLLLEQPQTALFANLPRSREIFAKRFLTRAILSTDMEFHMETYKKLGSSDYSQLDYSTPAKASESTQFLANLIIHTADVSGQLYPIEIALQWERAISEEFARQSCNEQRLGLTPLVFMMNLDKLYYRCKGQISFISHVLKPWWEELTRWFPTLNDNADILMMNLEHYQDIVNQIDYYNEYLMNHDRNNNTPNNDTMDNNEARTSGSSEESSSAPRPPLPGPPAEDDFYPDGLCIQCEHDGEWVEVLRPIERRALYSYVPSEGEIPDENAQLDEIYYMYHNYDPETSTITIDHSHLSPSDGMKHPVNPSTLDIPTICDKNTLHRRIQRVWKCQLTLPVIPLEYDHDHHGHPI